MQQLFSESTWAIQALRQVHFGHDGQARWYWDSYSYMPSMISEPGVPSVISECGVPSRVSEHGVPSVTSERGVPSVISERGVPSVISERGVPSVISECGVPSRVSEHGVPSVISVHGVVHRIQDGETQWIWTVAWTFAQVSKLFVQHSSSL